MSEKFLRIRDVMSAVGLSKSTLYREIAAKRFPKPVKLLSPRTSAWLASEIEAWQRARISERDRKVRS